MAVDLSELYRRRDSIDVVQADVTAADPDGRSVTLEDGRTIDGDYLVLAAGSQANFFGTPAPSTSSPSTPWTMRGGSARRVLDAFEEAERDPSTIEAGGLTFVVVGAGATGTEVSGALADLIRDVMPSRFHDLALNQAKVIIVDAGNAVLGPFSPKAHDYASGCSPSGRRDPARHQGRGDRRGSRRPVRRRLDRHALCDLGRRDRGRAARPRRRVEAGARRADRCARGPDRRGSSTGLRRRRPREHPRSGRRAFPQLGSVALQAGHRAAENILLDVDGKPMQPFVYHDKGIMAMIGHNAAIAEMGEHRHELHGAVGYAAWLGVHAYLMGITRQRRDASSTGHGTSSARAAVLDKSDEARLHWEGTPMPERYDVIIIGTGAGGGTLANTLAPTGKRILLLERGDFLPRERENWEPDPVFIQGRYIRKTRGTTPTARLSSRRCITTSAARPRCTAPPCTGCVLRISAS